jgi:hypothetical protein
MSSAISPKPPRATARDALIGAGRRMSVIPCERDDRLRAEIARFAEALKTEAFGGRDFAVSSGSHEVAEN